MVGKTAVCHLYAITEGQNSLVQDLVRPRCLEDSRAGPAEPGRFLLSQAHLAAASRPDRISLVRFILGVAACGGVFFGLFVPSLLISELDLMNQ